VVRLLLLAALAALACSGCGAAGDDRPNEPATLVLDSPPAGVHAGLFLAKERAYDEAEGVNLRIRRRGDGARALASGRADLALLPIDELGAARERGDDFVGVMAIVQEPLDAVFSDAARPRDLAGRRVHGDRAVLRSVIEGDGGDPASAQGAAGRVGRWDLDPGARAFHLDDYGAPSFPGLVLAATRQTIDERAPAVRAAIRALQRGYQQAQADPESAVTAIPAPDAAAQLDAVAPAFTAGAQGVGQLRMPVLREWAAWARKYGALRRPLDVSRAFDPSLVGRPPSAD
jgi:putative hydroxymethylpyrimidine transport system substrate-binding protein